MLKTNSKLCEQQPTASTATIVEPTGVPANIDTIIPANAQIIDKITEQIVTARKVLIADNFIHVGSGGKVKPGNRFVERQNFFRRAECTRQ